MTSFNFPALGPFTPATPAPSLASFIGRVAATHNMMPGNGGRNNDGKTLYGQSTNFTSWTAATANVTVTNVTSPLAPDSTAGVQKIAESVSTFGSSFQVGGGFGINVQNSLGATVYRLYAVAMKAERTRIIVQVQHSSDVQISAKVGFDLAGGNTNYSNQLGTRMVLVGIPTMVSMGGGWWLCKFDVVLSPAVNPNVTGNWQMSILLDNGSGTAANSPGYNGVIGNGVYLWQGNMLPAAAYSLTNVNLFDDFNDLSTMDLGNTRLPGYNWYISTIFPNTQYTFDGFAPPPHNPVSPIVNPVPASYFSISSPSVLKLFNPGNSANNGFDLGMQSVAPGLAGGASLVGNFWRQPVLHESWWSYDGHNGDINAQQYCSFNTFWSMSTEIFDGTINPLTLFRQAENDYSEGGGFSQATTDASVNFFTNPASPSTNLLYATNFGNDGGWLLGLYHRISVLYISAAANQAAGGPPGFGCQQAYVDGALIDHGDYVLSGTYGMNEAMYRTVLYGAQSGLTGHPLGAGGNATYIDWFRATVPAAPLNYFAYWNPWTAGADLVLDFAAVTLTKPSGGGTVWESMTSCSGKFVGAASNTIAAGKWYWEYTLSGAGIASTTSVILGLMSVNATIPTNFPGATARGAGLQYNTAANTNLNGVSGTYAGVTTWVANDVIGFAFDAVAGKVWIHKNGTWLNGTPGAGTDVWHGFTSGAGESWFAAVGMHDTGNQVVANFGSSAFAFSLPSGYTGWDAHHEM